MSGNGTLETSKRYRSTKSLRQWVPAHRQDHRQDGNEHGYRRKEDTDLGGLAGRDHIGGEALKDILKLTGTCSNVIFSTGRCRDLFQGIFIDLSAETTAPTSPSAEWRTEASAKPKRILVSAVHRRAIVCRPKPDRIHPYTAFYCLLRGSQWK